MDFDFPAVINDSMPETLVSTISTTATLLRLLDPRLLPVYGEIRGNIQLFRQETAEESMAPKKECLISEPPQAANVPNFRLAEKAQTLCVANDKKRLELADLIRTKTPSTVRHICGIQENFRELRSCKHGLIGGRQAADINDDFYMSGIQLPQKVRIGTPLEDVDEIIAKREFWIQEMKKKSIAVMRAIQ